MAMGVARGSDCGLTPTPLPRGSNPLRWRLRRRVCCGASSRRCRRPTGCPATSSCWPPPPSCTAGSPRSRTSAAPPAPTASSCSSSPAPSPRSASSHPHPWRPPSAPATAPSHKKSPTCSGGRLSATQSSSECPRRCRTAA